MTAQRADSNPPDQPVEPTPLRPADRRRADASRRRLGNLAGLGDASEPRFSVDQAAQRTGLDPDMIRRLRRAIGLADDADDIAVSREDLEALRVVSELLGRGLADEQLTLQMARTMGHAMSRVTTAQMTTMRAWLARSIERSDADDPLAVAEALEAADGVIDVLEFLLVYTWRRLLGEAAQGSDRESDPSATQAVEVVGFGDLVDFMGRSHRLDPGELAAVIDHFEALAFDVVAGHGGRVVKMIGDEVMFSAPNPAIGIAIALELSERCAADPDLMAIRVGLNYGPVVRVGGDLFGPTVNYASRLVDLARSGSVLVSEPLRIELSDVPGLKIRAKVRRVRSEGWSVVHEVSRPSGSRFADRAEIASIQDLAITAVGAGRDVIGALAGAVGDHLRVERVTGGRSADAG